MFNLYNLNDIRYEMISEIHADIEKRIIYISDRLNVIGKSKYLDILLQAAKHGTVESFIDKLNLSYFNSHYSRKLPSGGMTSVKMPSNANVSLCEGKFNRYYIRGLCIKAIANGRRIVVYRARHSNNPRTESEKIIGKEFDPQQILNDLRNNIGVDTAFGLPPGPNSGVSAKMA